MISCTHSVHLVHVGDFKPFGSNVSGNIISSKEEQFVFLGFTTDTSYINKARKKLVAQCKNGSIQSPVTKLSTEHGFLSWTNKISMKARCVN